ncbi:uncharacterized protein EV422DRAFT_524309 [Fimicolochytrium jonesii]|uniref:uncharacterized protein n=1 Tax=Fimicolochytrium jonesii TaxID=1396493 RepID=UPI0022FE4701|nr:uncharacterized protein EV422DRAFT_524309 [Fimicolochytrium jonesii]KAI8822519.1 hypothetical protein EV422DRAFT_524309 [Fimicolochytrium jonesii]
MALSFSKIWARQGVDIVDLFFEKATDAEMNRDREHHAAISIQRCWRGFLVRRRIQTLHSTATIVQRYYRGFRGREDLSRLIFKRSKDRRIRHYHDMAVRVQRIWRGFWVREYVFDYYKRKAYLENVKQKIEEFRIHLDNHAAHQHQQHLDYIHDLAVQKSAKLAATRHHLLGTKAVPGVYSGPVGHRRTVEMSVSEALAADSTVREGTCTPKESEYRRNRRRGRSASPAKEVMRRHKLLPPLYIAEEDIRSSGALKEWVDTHVGVRNYKGDPIKAVHRGKDGEDKRVQGPFKIEWELEKIVHKPLQPTLRVQTDFLDTVNAQRQERWLQQKLRIADEIFKVVPQVKHVQPNYSLEPMSTA